MVALSGWVQVGLGTFEGAGPPAFWWKRVLDVLNNAAPSTCLLFRPSPTTNQYTSTWSPCARDVNSND